MSTAARKPQSRLMFGTTTYRPTLFYAGHDGAAYRIDPDGRLWRRDESDEPARWRAIRVVDYRDALRDLVSHGNRGTLQSMGWAGEAA